MAGGGELGSGQIPASLGHGSNGRVRETMRGLVRTYWWLWLGRRWPIVAVRRGQVGRGGALLWRRRFGEVGRGWWGLRASWGQGQGSTVLDWSRAAVEMRFHVRAGARLRHWRTAVVIAGKGRVAGYL